MATQAKSQLEKSRKNLQELGNALSNLVNSFPDVFEDPEIKSRLQGFEQAYTEALQRLENPTFSIATIGTTSSGKSTIVNALIGRKIAPIEAGEMSGGVLTLLHSEDRTLTIEETEGATWETGSWSGLSDDALYDKIQKVMATYHDTRKKKVCLAPRLTASAPLLPVASPQILGLPPGVGVEIIDLPGLKSIQDRDNLQVIQQRVHKAFSLVALDYGQVDEQQRKKLLEELKRVVEYLQGRTDSMIFILNRVDLRGVDDLPIEQRIEQLKAEIQEVLSLSEPPDIIPFSSRMLYYAQCAWGSVSLAQPSTTDSETRNKFLKGIFHDCQGIIARYTENNWDLDDWFRDIRRKVSQENPVSDEQIKKIVDYALQWSGGGQLWNCIRRRVQESFSELVILPALFEVFDNYDSLTNTLDIVIETRKISNREQIQKEREKNARTYNDLLESIKKINQEFEEVITDYANVLKTGKQDAEINRMIQKAEENQRKGFQVIFNAAKEVQGDLTQHLIVPVRDALENNQGAFDLEEQLKEFISPSSASDIARAYENVNKRLSKNFTAESGYLVKRVRADDTKGKEEMERDEKYVRLFYHTMRQGLTSRAEFFLQAKAQEFFTVLEVLVDNPLIRLEYCLPDTVDLDLLDIKQAVKSELQKKMSENPPSLPHKFFDIDINVKQQTAQQEEVVGQKARNIQYTEGSCFWKETKTKTVMEDVKGKVDYKELYLPGKRMMAQHWSSGIDKGKDSLWDLSFKWILNRLKEVSEMLKASGSEVASLVDRALQEQLEILEKDFEVELQKWAEFELQKNESEIARQKLEQEFRV